MNSSSSESYESFYFLTALDIKCTFKIAGAGTLVYGTYQILKHSLGDPVSMKEAFAGILPVGASIIAIGSGCVCLTVQVESLPALKALWEMYESGFLQKSLQDILVTKEINEMAEGEEVELQLNIDQDSYRNAYLDLFMVENEGKFKILSFNTPIFFGSNF